MKTLSALLLWLIGLPALAADHAVILMYHHVSDSTPPSTSISPERFSRHLDFLAEQGYRVLALDELLARLRGGQSLPERSVALTFDDGYRSVYEQAFPLLRERGLPFTLFLNTEPIDQGLKGHLDWDQLREMARHGATLANHGLRHDHMAARKPGEDLGDWRRRVRQDLDQARRRIREETGQDHRLFAYPYGEFTAELQQLVEELDHVGFGQQSGAVGATSDFTALPRYPMAEAQAGLEALREKLTTRPFPLAGIQRPDNPLPAGQRPELVLTLQRPLSRPEALRCYAGAQGEARVRWLDPLRFAARVESPLPPGRSRYNCTAPARAGGYYWYSAPWVSLDEAGRWPED